MADDKNAKAIRQQIADDKTSKAADKAYKKSTVYPETEDVVGKADQDYENMSKKDFPTTKPLADFAMNMFKKDVPAYKRAAGAAALVPAAAATVAERGVRYLGRKMSGDNEEGKKRGGAIKKYASGGSIRGGGIEQRGKTKGRMV